MRIQNKSVIVTGVGGGIGEGIAVRLAVEGGNVIVNDINAAAAERVAAAICAGGGPLDEARRGKFLATIPLGRLDRKSVV